MANYEQSRTENGRGNRSSSTRTSVFKNISNSILGIASREQADERKKEKYALLGTGKYTMNGSNDRINGKIYNGDNNDLYPTEEDKRSYHYGYFIHGSRRLYAVIETLQKANRIEEIIAIGYRDYEHGVAEEYLGMLKENEYYMEGYNSAKKAKKSR
jgi:hypothetical protein